LLARKNARHDESVEAEHFMLIPSSEVSARDASHVKEQQLVVQTIKVSGPGAAPQHRHAEQQERIASIAA
jgi:hypothetical protein